MDWILYQKRFKISAKRKGFSYEFINRWLDYAKKLYDQELPIIFDVEHFSRLVGYRTSYLYAVTNNKTKCYYNYTIKKHSGNDRRISEPYPELKKIQTWILHNVLESIRVSKYSKGYQVGLSLKDNVRFHIRQPVIIKLDIKDFFPSIKRKFVVNLFLQLGYSRTLSGLMGRLCCYLDSLPQGAPTSPYLSNVFLNKFDNRIGKYVTKCGFRYTRYSDDITISGDISKKQIGTIISFCRKRLGELGLILNEEKIQILRPYNRQVVTGIILNNKPSIGVATKKKIRQQVYYIKKYGLESHILHEEIRKGNYIYHLAGMINWVLFIEKDNKEFIEYKDIIMKIIKEKTISFI